MRSPAAGTRRSDSRGDSLLPLSAVGIPRLQAWELRAKTIYGDIAGTSLIDWPITYKELRTYYEIAERRLGVTRRNGVPGLPASNNFKVMYAGAKKLGYQQVHTGHLAINSRAFDGRSFCIQQGFCVQGCKIGAKWSALYTEIPRAEATGNLDLRVESTAIRIEHGDTGRVNAVVYRDGQGREQRQKARAVCVAGEYARPEGYGFPSVPQYSSRTQPLPFA